MKVDVLYTAWNRQGFVAYSFPWLLAHTQWQHVDRLIVYDDGSEDGTQEYLRQTIGDCPVPHELRVSDLRSVPAIMNHYVATSEAEVFAKIDSDIALPPGWLKKMRGVWVNTPGVDLLGMEAGMMGTEAAGNTGYTAEPASYIGGVGLMRVKAFRDHPRIPERGSHFGFTEWQDRYPVRAAWITPDLPCPQLDKIPCAPFEGLTISYIENGWSRRWPPYPRDASVYWDWMKLEEKEEA